MSNIASDTRDIAQRMTKWESPFLRYTSIDIPDWEYLRVHSLRLADAFDEVSADLRKAQSELHKARNIDTREKFEAAFPEWRYGFNGSMQRTALPDNSIRIEASWEHSCFWRIAAAAASECERIRKEMT